jgi:hypothetical protein
VESPNQGFEESKRSLSEDHLLLEVITASSSMIISMANLILKVYLFRLRLDLLGFLGVNSD